MLHCNWIKAFRKATVLTTQRHTLPAAPRLPAGLLRHGCWLRRVGRKQLISTCLCFRPSTAPALFHLQMIKWSTGQLWTGGRNSQLSPGFLNQPDWISQRQRAVAEVVSMTFPGKYSPAQNWAFHLTTCCFILLCANCGLIDLQSL